MSPIQKTERIPLWLKIAFTAFMAVLVPVYWYCYGPTNFLYFCDVALLLTLVGMWRESKLLISMASVGIILPQLVWVADFFVGLTGHQLTGMTNYMFNADLPLFLRGLSLFHGWLPFMLLYLVWRVGYEKRAIFYWTALAWSLIIFCYLAMPGPRPDAGSTPVNINYVHGMDDAQAQTWMPALAWVATLMSGLLVVIFVPTHVVLKRLFAKRTMMPAVA